MPFLKHDRITPAQVVILGFLFQILIGACLLSLPVATQSGERVPSGRAVYRHLRHLRHRPGDP